MRFVKEKYVSTPLIVGEVFLTPDAKAGYYNYRRITAIEDRFVKTEIVEHVNGGYKVVRSDGGMFELNRLQKHVDSLKKENHDKQQTHKKNAHDFCKKLKLDKVKGGNVKSHIVAKELSKILKSFKAESEYLKRSSDSIPAGGFSGANSSTMRSSRSGVPISFNFNNCHYGGYYGFNRMFNVQIQIGGALPIEHINILTDVAKKILSLFYHETDLGMSRIETSDGTNWSSVMMIAPTKDGKYNPMYVFD